MKRRSLIHALIYLVSIEQRTPVLAQATNAQWKPIYSNGILIGATNGTQQIGIPLEGQAQLTTAQQLAYEQALQSPGKEFISRPYYHDREGRTYSDSVVFHPGLLGFKVFSQIIQTP